MDRVKRFLGELVFRIDCLFWKYRLRKFKNIHDGESVVIVGSGPSVNNFDFSKISNLKIIACNASCTLIVPDYICVIDPQFSYMKSVFEISKKTKAKLFLVNAWISLKQRKYNYINQNILNGPWKKRDHIKWSNIDAFIKDLSILYRSPDMIEDGVTSVSNVVSELAIPLALYMGFKKVYFIGVDMTMTNGRHFYAENPEDELKYLEGDVWAIRREGFKALSEVKGVEFANLYKDHNVPDIVYQGDII